MRLFFAVHISAEAVRRVERAQAQLRERIGDEGVRWTRPEQFHFTLKFLGETPPARIGRLLEGANAVRGTQPFELGMAGIGAFPTERRPGTLWIGVTDGADELAELASNLDALLFSRGFPKEKRTLKAHLTLARISSYAGEVSAARALREAETGEIARSRVDRFTLMESRTRPSGAEYRVIEEFRLD